jgi:hypothetical protein
MCTINFSIVWISYCKLGFSSFQVLSIDEEAAVPICSLAETMHNKWFQASGNNMTDLYNATLDDYCRATLQSTAYHNFLKGVGGGTGPNRSVLRLCSATRSGDPSKIARVVGELSADVGLNSRVPHLEGERIFGFAKRKLDLPPRDESDSHRHNQVNFSVPKIGYRMTLGQSRQRRGLNESTGDALAVVAYTMGQLPVRESECDPMSWRIERVSPISAAKCKGHLNGKHCGSKIAKYHRAIPCLTFTGIQRKSGSKSTEQKQSWFCPSDATKCVLAHSKWIVHYPDVLQTWPMMEGTNLTQAEVEGLEVARFKINDGEEVFDNLHEAFLARQADLVQPSRPPKGSGDYRPTTRENKAFRFVPDPSTEHLAN